MTDKPEDTELQKMTNVAVDLKDIGKKKEFVTDAPLIPGWYFYLVPNRTAVEMVFVKDGGGFGVIVVGNWEIAVGNIKGGWWAGPYHVPDIPPEKKIIPIRKS